jgi:hypothetical protein
MPADELHTDCAARYAGVPHLPVDEVTRGVIADAALLGAAAAARTGAGRSNHPARPVADAPRTDG